MTGGGLVAERPCTGLQIPPPRFDSGRGLQPRRIPQPEATWPTSEMRSAQISPATAVI